MADPQLLAYVQTHLRAGIAPDMLRNTMKGQGWSDEQIAAALIEALNTPPPPPTVPPPPAPMPPGTPQTPAPARALSSGHRRLVGGVVAVCLALGALGGIAYAYTQGLLPSLSFFNKAPYASGHFFEGVAAGFGKIQSSSYALSLDITAQQRDAGAQPFVSSSTQSSFESVMSLASYVAPDLHLALGVTGAAQHTDTGINSRATFAADVSSSDFSMSFAAEVRKVGDNLYLLINKFPTALFSGVSGILGQWVAITPADQQKLGGGFASSTLSMTQKADTADKLKKVLMLADADQALTETGMPAKETLDGTQVYRYDLMLNPATYAGFYSDVKNALNIAPADGITRPDPTSAYLQSAEGQHFLNYLRDNVVFHLWADTQGVPRKFEVSMRVVPSDNVVRLKDKQVHAVFDVILKDINTPVVIDAPTKTLTADEAQKLVFGTTLSDSRMKGRDARRVADIKQIQLGLELYYNDHGSYPGALSQLAPNYLPVVPKDPLDATPYVYRSVGGGRYRLGAGLEDSQSAALKSSTSTSCAPAGRYCYEVYP